MLPFPGRHHLGLEVDLQFVSTEKVSRRVWHTNKSCRFRSIEYSIQSDRACLRSEEDERKNIQQHEGTGRYFEAFQNGKYFRIVSSSNQERKDAVSVSVGHIVACLPLGGQLPDILRETL